MFKSNIGTALLCVALLVGCGNEKGSQTPPPSNPSPQGGAQLGDINWMTNYNQAQQKAQRENKPLFLYFNGSDWCHWCQKLDQEILSQPGFIQKVRDHFIFVRVDFPQNNPLPEQQAMANERLKDMFHVQGFPTIVIVNGKGEVLGELGYRAMSPENYADTALTMAHRGSNFSTSMANFDPTTYTMDQLREMYQEAELLNRPQDAQRILTAALEKTPQDPFFLAQKYRLLLEDGKYGSPEAVALRQQLLNSSPNQSQELSFFVSFLDFRALAESKTPVTSEKAVAPLKEFLAQYPDQSPFRWRVEMIMGEYLASRGSSEEALNYYKLALNDAPERAKPHIQQSIDLIQKSKEGQSASTQAATEKVS
jgi:protein disulfide-isomerase